MLIRIVSDSIKFIYQRLDELRAEIINKNEKLDKKLKRQYNLKDVSRSTNTPLIRNLWR